MEGGGNCQRSPYDFRCSILNGSPGVWDLQPCDLALGDFFFLLPSFFPAILDVQRTLKAYFLCSRCSLPSVLSDGEVLGL